MDLGAFTALSRRFKGRRGPLGVRFRFVEVRVLGPLEVVDEQGDAVPVRGRGLQRLLAVLAIRANEVVSADHLIEVIWGDDHPQNPRGALQILISRLRKVMGPTLSTRDHGYLLRLSPDDLDVTVFERLVAEARRAATAGQHGEAIERLRAGLRLWRGSDFTNLAEASEERPVLVGWQELRAHAEELLAEAELASGHHQEALGHLERMVEAEPLREQRWALLMLALYRAGRQAEALAAYRRLVTLLGDELGIEPGAAVADLEEQILLHDRRLDWNPPEKDTTERGMTSPSTLTFVVAAWDGAPPEMAPKENVTSYIQADGTRLAAMADPRAAVIAAAELAALGARVGVHVGQAAWENGRLVGLAVHRAARVAAAARFGQALLSAMTHQILESEHPSGVDVVPLGEFRLPGITGPESLFQVTIEGSDRLLGEPLADPMVLTNLPQQLDTFVGRARDIDDLGKLLDDNRLVTLTGPGGIGKTRLALQVAADRVSRFRHGVWFADLSRIAVEDDVEAAIARALEVDNYQTVEDLGAFARDRELLLVVDNCEHVIEAATDIVHRLLKGAPGLSILATSRQRLGIPGEVASTVLAMSTPGVSVTAVEELMASDVVALFATRAAARRPGFTVEPSNALAIAELCRRLDGIPLAIELAASRVVTLEPTEILERLAQDEAIVSTRDRAVHSRHRTLDAVIRWSHDSLTDEERVLFRRLSIFRGGFTVEMAEEVCCDDQLAVRVLLDAIEGLADKSLLVVESAGGTRRFSMLVTVREFAARELDRNGETPTLAHRHAIAFSRMTELARPHLEKMGERVWFDQIAAEHENIRAALAWSRSDAGDPEVGFQMLAATIRYWGVTGRWQEGVREAQGLLERGDSIRGVLRADVEWAGGLLSLFMGHQETAAGYLQSALASYQVGGGLSGAMRVLNALGTVEHDRGDMVQADLMYERAAHLAEQLGEAEYLGKILNNRGTVAESRGDYDAAFELYSIGLRAAQKSGSLVDEAIAVTNLADVTVRQGRLDEAASLFSEGARLAKQIGDPLREAGGTLGIAWVEFLQGHDDRAASLFPETLDAFQQLGADNEVLKTLGRMALLARRLNEPRRAATLLAAEQQLRGAGSHGASDDHDLLVQLESELRDSLGADYEESAARGKEMSLDEVVAFATSA